MHLSKKLEVNMSTVDVLGKADVGELENAFKAALDAADKELSKYGLTIAKLDMKPLNQGSHPGGDWSALGGVCVCYRGVCGCVIW